MTRQAQARLWVQLWVWDLGQMWDLPGLALAERQMLRRNVRRHYWRGCWERTQRRSKVGSWLQQ